VSFISELVKKMSEKEPAKWKLRRAWDDGIEEHSTLLTVSWYLREPEDLEMLHVIDESKP